MKTSAIVAAGIAVLLLATPAGAQGRSYQFPDVTTLVGPGSSIGVRVRELTRDELTSARLESEGGAYIEEATPGTPAERAGLKAGDIVLEFDGERVRSVRTFRRLVSETPPQRTVKATVLRAGSRITIDVTPEMSGGWSAQDFAQRFGRDFPMLRAFPRDLPAPSQRPRTAPLTSPRHLGITLSAIDGQLAAYFGVANGVLVLAVELDSPAAQAGIKAGDVITAMNGRSVRLPADVSEAARDATPGGTLELKVVRDKKEITLHVTFAAASASRAPGQVHT